MRVVLDTNVLVAALISPHHPPDRVFQAWLAGVFTLVTSGEQLDEFRRLLSAFASDASIRALKVRA
jgi:predicted nucleic acid-binding protein